jgi:hypothetical protein
MLTKRLGNDIRFFWSINDGEGQPYNLEDRALTLTLFSPIGQVPYGDLQVESNVIAFTLFGKDQTAHGKYYAVLSENAGEVGMKTVDITDVVNLVPRSFMEKGEDRCSHLTAETVNLESSVTVGVPGPRGLSLYDYAVIYYDFPGTAREFWLWYQKAKEDADTAAENASAAQESIEASERARAAEFTRLSGLIEEAVANADSLVDRLRTFPTVFVDELPEASASTLYSFYLVPNPSDPDVKDIYLTEKKQDGTYAWRKVGGTNIAFNEYLRKDDVVLLTEDEYDALRDPDPNKYYLTFEDDGEEDE